MIKARRNLYLLGFLILAGAPAYLSGYELSLVGRFLALGICSLGLVLTWGRSGILSLGQGVFFGLGGYAIAMHLKLARLGPNELPDFMEWSGLSALPWWWEPFRSPAFALAATIVVPTLCAGAIAYLVFRRRVSGVYFALLTQALAVTFSTLLISQQGVTGGFNGLTDFSEVLGFSLADARTQVGLYWITLALLVLAFLISRWILGTHFGWLLWAIRERENRVRFLGYQTAAYKTAVFTIGGLFAGVSGALFTLHAGVISPAMVGVVPSIEMVVWVAVGGRESLAGAIWSTVLVNLVKDWVSSAMPELWLFVMGGLFVLVVTAMPGGIQGACDSLVQWLMSWLGDARGRRFLNSALWPTDTESSVNVTESVANE